VRAENEDMGMVRGPREMDRICAVNFTFNIGIMEAAPLIMLNTYYMSLNWLLLLSKL